VNVVRIIVCGMGNLPLLPTNFAVSGPLRSRLMGQHLSDEPRDLVMAFDFGDHGAASDAALYAPAVYQV